MVTMKTGYTLGMPIPLPDPTCLALNRQIEESRPSQFAAALLDLYQDAALIGDSLSELDADYGQPIRKGETARRFEGQECSSVGTLFAYHKYNFNDLPFGKREREHLARELHRSPKQISSEHSGYVRGSRLMLWVTLTSDLDAELRNTASPATVVRNVLGLVHHLGGTELIRFRFPNLPRGAVRIPTFIDGADSAAFCLWKALGECGYTWRLDRQHSGCPEGVTEPIKLDAKVAVDFLGSVHPPCPSIDRDKIITRGNMP
jgi:hypothetical protein